MELPATLVAQMNVHPQRTNVLFLFAAFFLAAVPALAEEQPNRILTALNSTTISGYMDSSAHLDAAQPLGVQNWRSPAGHVNASTQIVPTNSTYIGVVPHKTNAAVVFEVRLANRPNRPLSIQLLGYSWDGLGGAGVISLIGSVTYKPNGFVCATFPFGGRYRGRFDPERNVIVGRLYGFTKDRQNPISHRRFELQPDDPSSPDVPTFPGPWSSGVLTVNVPADDVAQVATVPEVVFMPVQSP